LEPGRLSDKGGGRPEYSQAQYFVSFSGVRASQSEEVPGKNARNTKAKEEARSAESAPSSEPKIGDRTENVHLEQTVQLAFLGFETTRTKGDGLLVIPMLVAFFALLAFLGFVASTTNQNVSALVDSLQRLTSLLERILGPWFS
jgi:predicted small integral membrane protein